MARVPRLTETPSPSRPAWIPAIVSAIAGALIGAFATLSTGVLSYWSHQGDIDTKMIELSIDVLRAKPTSGGDPLRDWAIDMIERRANFKFSADQRQALLKEPLPNAAISAAIGTAIRSQMPPSP